MVCPGCRTSRESEGYSKLKDKYCKERRLFRKKMERGDMRQ